MNRPHPHHVHNAALSVVGTLLPRSECNWLQHLGQCR